MDKCFNVELIFMRRNFWKVRLHKKYGRNSSVMCTEFHRSHIVEAIALFFQFSTNYTFMSALLRTIMTMLCLLKITTSNSFILHAFSKSALRNQMEELFISLVAMVKPFKEGFVR